MSTIKIFVALNNLDDILPRYNQIQIFRSTTGYDGAYTELTGATTRINLEPGKVLYIYYDEAGAATYWYKSRLYNSDSLAVGDFSEAELGEETETLAKIMTVAELKAIYLTGVDLTNDQGVTYPDIMFDFAVRAAIRRVEHELDIECKPTNHTDRYNFDSRLFSQWGTIQCDHYPLISVSSIKMYWPSASDPYEFPAEWIRFDPQSGLINLVPTSGSLAQAMVFTGLYMPMIMTSVPFVPRAIEVTYQSGFAIGSLPHDIRDIIGMYASFPILNVAGDLIAGAGIASYSVGLDGLSQSVSTTSSATNAGYGSRLIQYQHQIKAAIPSLRRYYKGAGLRVA